MAMWTPEEVDPEFELTPMIDVVFLLIALALWRTVAVLAQIASEKPPTMGRYVLLYLPFSIHFGWLTAATALGVNVAVVAVECRDPRCLLCRISSSAPSSHWTLSTVLSSGTTAVAPWIAPSGSDSSSYTSLGSAQLGCVQLAMLFGIDERAV